MSAATAAKPSPRQPLTVSGAEALRTLLSPVATTENCCGANFDRESGTTIVTLEKLPSSLAVVAPTSSVCTSSTTRSPGSNPWPLTWISLPPGAEVPDRNTSVAVGASVSSGCSPGDGSPGSVWSTVEISAGGG